MLLAERDVALTQRDALMAALASRVAEPDQARTHAPTGCNGCGADLTDAPVVGVETRQVFDLPVIELIAIEHRGPTPRVWLPCGHPRRVPG